MVGACLPMPGGVPPVEGEQPISFPLGCSPDDLPVPYSLCFLSVDQSHKSKLAEKRVKLDLAFILKGLQIGDKLGELLRPDGNSE